MPATHTIVGAPDSGYRWHAAVLAVVTLAAIFVYLNALNGGFVWDDRKLIVDDPAITSWNHLGEIFSSDFFSRNEDDVPYGYYRPVTTTSYLVDYTIWGLKPFGYHLTNVLLHAACTAMVALILLRLGFGLSASAIAALLFAVHPIHTENVAWIAGRTDLLAFFFTGLALLLHPLGSTRGPPVQDPTPLHAAGVRRLRPWLFLAASVLAFALALLAKEMSVVLIPWLCLIHRLVRRHSWRASVIAVLPYASVLAVYLAWRFLILKVWLPGELPDQRLSNTLLSSGPTIVRYLIWMLVPIDLNAYVQNPYVTTALDLRLFGSLVVLVLLGLMLWRFGAAERVLLLGSMLAVSFVPVLNFARAAAPADMGDMMAERFCYFASFPFLALIGMAVAWALARTGRIAPLRYVLSAGMLAVVALGALRTMERNRDWNNELGFLTKTLEQSPNAVLLWGNLAGYHLRRRDLDQATRALEHAEALDSNSHAILSSRALWYVVSGRVAEAIPIQKRIVREAKRGQTAALNNLAYLYRMTGQQEQAQSILEALIRSGTNRADPHFNLGEIYHAQGHLDEAHAEYQLALEDRPNDLRSAEALASLDVSAGRADAAEAIYRRLLTVYPDDARIWNNLALVRHGQGDNAGALEILARVVQNQPGYLKARINYAEILRDSGRPSEAIAQLEKVRQAGAGTELGTLATQQLAALQPDHGARAPRKAKSADARGAAGTTPVALDSTGHWTPPRTVVLVTVDTLRADFVSFNGHQPVTTPFLDTLAQSGVVFTQAYAPSSWTVPSMASLFTSLAPTSHGITSAVVRRGQVVAQRKLPDSLTTLAEGLKHGGYLTVGVPANLHLASALGFAQGFDYYGEAEFMQAPEVNSQAGIQLQHAFGAEWETAWRERKTFLWIHYFDPHDPYLPHAPWISRYAPEFENHASDFPAGLVMRDIRRRYPKPDSALAAHIKPLYESEISYVDEYLRRLSEQLMLDDDNVLLIVTADHGEEIVDHQSLGHGHTLYQELLHVPLLMHWPAGLPQGMRIDNPVSLLDIYPTLVEMLGLETPPGLQGESLAGLLRKKARNQPRKLFFELDNRRAHPVTLRAVRDGEWKLIREQAPGRKTMLFNLALDPAEQNDVSVEHHEVVGQLETALQTWLDALPQPPLDRKSVPIDESTKERLKALGYLQ